MGQSSIILAVAATFAIGVLVLGMQRGTNKADEELAGYHYDVLAREAAATGMNTTVRQLADSIDTWTTTAFGYTNVPYKQGTYTTVVTALNADTVDVVSTGTFGVTQHILEARYRKGYMSDVIPGPFKYAIISDLDLTLNGSAEILAANDSSNANIHANGNLTSNGNNIHIEGYGTYSPSGSGTINPGNAIDTVFDPNVDYNDSEANMYEDEYIDIPNFDTTPYTSIPPSTFTTASDTSLTGVIDLQAWATSLGFAGYGTEANPFVLYVNGNLTMSGGVTMLGYGQVVVSGSIDISGSVTSSTTPVPAHTAPDSEWDAWTAANLDAAGKTKIGYYANGDITVSGNSAVVGQLWSNNTVTLNGGGGQTSNVLGGIIASETDIGVNGGLVIRYSEVSKAGIPDDLLVDIPSDVKLIAWAEW